MGRDKIYKVFHEADRDKVTKAFKSVFDKVTPEEVDRSFVKGTLSLKDPDYKKSTSLDKTIMKIDDKTPEQIDLINNINDLLEGVNERSMTIGGPLGEDMLKFKLIKALMTYKRALAVELDKRFNIPIDKREIFINLLDFIMKRTNKLIKE